MSQEREVHIEKNSYKRNSLRTIWVKRRCVCDHFRSNEPRYVMRPFVIQSHKKMRLLTSYDVSLFIYFFFNGRQHFNPSNKNHNKREEEQVGKSSDLSGEPLVSTSWTPCPIGSFERWGRVKTKAKIRKACSSLKNSCAIDIQPSQTFNFSVQYHPWIKCKGHDNRKWSPI